MEDFAQKKLVTKPNSLTYNYYTSPSLKAGDSKSPTLLFVHGFPDDASMWSSAISYFKSQKWRMVVVDLIGFGGSSKPTDATLYRYKQQSDSLAQILEAEGMTDNIIPIGHDWGSAVVQRFYLYYKERCSALALVSAPYQAPSDQPFMLEQVNEIMTQVFGYPSFAYWDFFRAPDAHKIIFNDLPRFYEVLHGNYPSPKPEDNGRDTWIREMFCTPGAMRDYMLRQGRFSDFTVDLKPYPDGERLQKVFIDRFIKDGIEGGLLYYSIFNNDENFTDECSLKKAGDAKLTIDVPLLYIGQTGDFVCRPELLGQAKQAGLVPDVEEHVVEAGHWILYEKPKEVAELIEGWLVRRGFQS